jgi:hypothetical protein
MSQTYLDPIVDVLFTSKLLTPDSRKKEASREWEATSTL